LFIRDEHLIILQEMVDWMMWSFEPVVRFNRQRYSNDYKRLVSFENIYTALFYAK